ncbi:hypothetical protein B5X24_HaOG204029 [Helicoverpa armigera]|uniref:Uncharacterized protein n=1 Tax=Helicoverpa armigera TaxID=29058 RepID=A0A2W1BVR7_HELAM|nr:hypothetical protein B5X24_HaOG204029 [Helicoverpa armigera]
MENKLEIIHNTLFNLPLLDTGLFSYGKGLRVNHHACSMRVGDFKLFSPGFLEMFEEIDALPTTPQRTVDQSPLIEENYKVKGFNY